MSGFLDKKTRVIDMVLTDYGKEMLSKGKLNFSYYAFSDDEVDYDPWIQNSGSLSQTELTASKVEQVENTLVREAVFGREFGSSPSSIDETNIKNLLFGMPQGQKVLPRMNVTPDVLSGSIDTVQQNVQTVNSLRNEDGTLIDKSDPVSIGYKKFKSTKLRFDLEIDDFFDRSTLDGFLVRTFVSSSTGLVEIPNKRDSDNNISYQNNLKVLLDEQLDDVLDSTPEKLGVKIVKRK